jgi:hypothetical protein
MTPQHPKKQHHPKRTEPQIHEPKKATPLDAVRHVKTAIDIMEKWMDEQRGKGLPLVVYQARTRQLSQFCKVIESRSDQIKAL